MRSSLLVLALLVAGTTALHLQALPTTNNNGTIPAPVNPNNNYNNPNYYNQPTQPQQPTQPTQPSNYYNQPSQPQQPQPAKPQPQQPTQPNNYYNQPTQPIQPTPPPKPTPKPSNQYNLNGVIFTFDGPFKYECYYVDNPQQIYRWDTCYDPNGCSLMVKEYANYCKGRLVKRAA